jgi:hypothetical protein
MKARASVFVWGDDGEQLAVYNGTTAEASFDITDLGTAMVKWTPQTGAIDYHPPLSR